MKRDKKKTLDHFHERLVELYRIEMNGSETNVLFKEKELWAYMIGIFTNYEKYAKKMKKAHKLDDFLPVIERLFDEQEIVDETQIFKQHLYNE